MRFPVPWNLRVSPHGFPFLPQKQAQKGETTRGSGDRMAVYWPRRGALEGTSPCHAGISVFSLWDHEGEIHVAQAAWFVVFCFGTPSADSGLGQSWPCLTPNLQGPLGQAATALVFLLQRHDGTGVP